MAKRACLVLILSLLTPHIASGQTTVSAPRDPNAIVMANKAVQTLLGGTALNDITLQARANYTAGSDLESGPATLSALGNEQSLVTLNLTNGTRREVRSGPAGDWTGPDGTTYAMAIHNCWSDAAWFYPGLSLEDLSTDAGLGLAYVGPESKNGVAVLHLRLFRAVANASGGANATILRLSAEDIYLDATSLVPRFLDFNVHPDADFGRNIPEEIVFGQYQTMNGIAVPMTIQKFLNGTLALSLSVTSTAINTGLSPAVFALSVVAGGAD